MYNFFPGYANKLFAGNAFGTIWVTWKVYKEKNMQLNEMFLCTLFLKWFYTQYVLLQMQVCRCLVCFNKGISPEFPSITKRISANQIIRKP